MNQPRSKVAWCKRFLYLRRVVDEKWHKLTEPPSRWLPWHVSAEYHSFNQAFILLAVAYSPEAFKDPAVYQMVWTDADEEHLPLLTEPQQQDYLDAKIKMGIYSLQLRIEQLNETGRYAPKETLPTG